MDLSAEKQGLADFTICNTLSPRIPKEMSPQEDSVITPSATETTDQEPPEDAREDADNLSARHATDATYPNANQSIKNTHYIFTTL
jgi:hypothetical protein